MEEEVLLSFESEFNDHVYVLIFPTSKDLDKQRIHC